MMTVIACLVSAASGGLVVHLWWRKQVIEWIAVFSRIGKK